MSVNRAVTVSPGRQHVNGTVIACELPAPSTTSLDAQSELLVQRALERLMQGRTTIIIGHRLATVLQADRLVVVNKGRIVATGSRNQLLASSPLYARLAELQFGVQTSAGSAIEVDERATLVG